MNAASRSDQPRALVTGLGGFTGRYLGEALAASGYRVFGTIHDAEAPGPDRVKVDLCNRADLAQVVRDIQPDVVAHLAAISFVAHGDAEGIYRTNVVGTRNLLEALAGLDRRPQSVLLASSANIYGNAVVSGEIDEQVRPNPANDYAVSKLAMEYMAALWMERLPITIVRPFNYTGVGQGKQFLLPKIVDHFKRGERLIELGNIDVERDFSDVRMVTSVYKRLLEIAPAGKVFNVCSGGAVSLKSVLQMMADIVGYSIEVRVNPAFVRENEVKRLQGSAAYLRSIIGAYDVIPLRETLRWMYAAN